MIFFASKAELKLF